jgi:sugar (pentulose or hexulose) kinase
LYEEDLNSDTDYIYSLMQDEAQESRVGARGLTFIPYLIGERVPIWDSDVRGVFFGIERYHRRADFIRSILESTGYTTLGLIKAIEGSGIAVNSIRMSGGMAKLPYVCRLRANVTGRPVHVLSEHETSAMGAFMVISQATGSSEGIHDMAQIARVVETYQPDYEIHKQYLELHELFNDVYTSLTSTFRKRTALMQRLSLSEISIVENL